MKCSMCFLMVVLVMSFFNGCKGPEGPAGPSLTGDIIGYVVLEDNNSNPLKDNSGVIVSLDGTSYSTTTASDGRFVLSGVSTGTYSVSFRKTGYGIMKIIAYPFVGGGQAFVGNTYLIPIPSFTVTNMTASISSSGNLELKGSLAGAIPSNFIRPITFFLSTSPTVSLNPNNYKNYIPFFIYNSDSTFDITYSTYFPNSDFHTGQTVYVIAYSGSGYLQYLDLATGKSVFPSLNPTPSNVISVVVP